MQKQTNVQILRAFHKVVGELHACRFVRQLREQDHTIRVTRDSTEGRYPEYDRDDFRSFATLFRKLVAKREPTQLFRVMNILVQYAPEDVRPTFKRVKSALKEAAEDPPLKIAIGAPGSEVPYTPQKICDILFNGVIFHSDHELQEDAGKLLDYEPFVMASFLMYACDVLNVSTQYANVIEHHKYFVEIDDERS